MLDASEVLRARTAHHADDEAELVPEAVAIAVSSMVAAVAQNGGESEIGHVGIGSLAFPVGR